MGKKPESGNYEDPNFGCLYLCRDTGLVYMAQRQSKLKGHFVDQWSHAAPMVRTLPSLAMHEDGLELSSLI